MSDANIRVNYHRHDLYDQMVEEWDLFNSYVDFFVFAASVGYATADEPTVRGYSEHEYKGDGEMLWMHFTNKHTYRAVAASIAYQYTNDPEALVDPEVQLDIMARYARAGVETLDQEFGDSVSTPRDGLLSFIDDYENPDAEDTGEEDILSKISSSFDQSISR